tara:strand:+ start:204 stop:449 length:246 start_codon:yes stop_codon:yes gene_type:complete
MNDQFTKEADSNGNDDKIKVYNANTGVHTGHYDSKERKYVSRPKRELIEELTHKVADIKYDLQVVLNTLYALDSELESEEQ